jgi:DNA-binding PadR family transcriptional regulator
LTLHDGYRAWKTFDWDAMNRLHEKGYIFNPVGKAKSVALTEEGLKESEKLFQRLFSK